MSGRRPSEPGCYLLPFQGTTEAHHQWNVVCGQPRLGLFEEPQAFLRPGQWQRQFIRSLDCGGSRGSPIAKPTAMAQSTAPTAPTPPVSINAFAFPRQGDHVTRDFWLFFTGETVSAFGSSFTALAVPLLVFRVTGSALALGAAAALSVLPYVFLGLPIGAWADRADRRRLLALADLLSALAVASLPIAAALGLLAVPSILIAVFAEATFAVVISAGRFGAIPSLVPQKDLVWANGRIQASFAVASILGPLTAGSLLAITSLDRLLVVDAASFMLAALADSLISRPLRVPRAPTSISADLVEGVRHVLRDPILSNCDHDGDRELHSRTNRRADRSAGESALRRGRRSGFRSLCSVGSRSARSSAPGGRQRRRPSEAARFMGLGAIEGLVYFAMDVTAKIATDRRATDSRIR